MLILSLQTHKYQNRDWCRIETSGDCDDSRQRATLGRSYTDTVIFPRRDASISEVEEPNLQLRVCKGIRYLKEKNCYPSKLSPAFCDYGDMKVKCVSLKKKKKKMNILKVNWILLKVLKNVNVCCQLWTQLLDGCLGRKKKLRDVATEQHFNLSQMKTVFCKTDEDRLSENSGGVLSCCFLFWHLRSLPAADECPHSPNCCVPHAECEMQVNVCFGSFLPWKEHYL